MGDFLFSQHGCDRSFTSIIHSFEYNVELSKIIMMFKQTTNQTLIIFKSYSSRILTKEIHYITISSNFQNFVVPIRCLTGYK